jgi:long-chain acyl-CoA synthetase
MDPLEGINEPNVLHFDDVLEFGGRHSDPQALPERMSKIEPEQMATLIYTSGTTGPPKGVMLTHRNFLINARQAFHSHEEIFEQGQIALSFLPLSHSLERLAGWYLLIYCTGAVYYAESANTVVDNMREIHPNFIIAVPRLFEKIYAGMQDKLSKASAFKKFLFHWCAGVGGKAASYLAQGKPLPFFLGLKYRLAKRLALDKIRAALGADRLKLFVSGGAPLSRGINEFFHSIGMPIHEGYGLSETSPLTHVNTYKNFRFGSVGKPVLDTEMKIAEDGEILLKGPQVMKGYFNKPEATAETFTDDGWFKTGDIGIIDDGYLIITDRKKDLIITAGGKNISPQNLENAIVTDLFVETIVAIGDAKPFISALIVPDFAVLENWAKEKGILFASRAELINNPKTQRLFEERLAVYNEKFARVEQIKKFKLLEQSFSQEMGELTPTLKVKRKVVNQKYKALLEEMYA